MRHEHDRLTVQVGCRAQQFENLPSGSGVEVAGRLVREDDPGSHAKSAGDRDTLLLATRELVRPSFQHRCQSEAVCLLTDPRLTLAVEPDPGELEREHDVVKDIENRHEVERLKDEANLGAPQLRQLGVREVGDPLRPVLDLT